MKDGWSIKAAFDFFQNGYAVAIFKGDALCTNLTFETRTKAQQIIPTFQAGPDGEAFLRAALNCAWEQGLRPDGFEDTRESMRATNAHLEDMRALAFHKIGAPKP